MKEAERSESDEVFLRYGIRSIFKDPCSGIERNGVLSIDPILQKLSGDLMAFWEGLRGREDKRLELL